MAVILDRREAIARLAPVRFWRTSVGKKAVMAVTGAILLLYLVAHMLGNLKVFFGAAAFDHYAHWLRTIGEPLLPYGWFLWLLRGVLTASVLLHIVTAAQLTARSRAARRGRGFAHRPRVRGAYAARTMRWGGVVIALFVVYHVLDITVGTLNPDYAAGRPYHNVTPTSGSGSWRRSTRSRWPHWRCTSGTGCGARRRRSGSPAGGNACCGRRRRSRRW